MILMGKKSERIRKSAETTRKVKKKRDQAWTSVNKNFEKLIDNNEKSRTNAKIGIKKTRMNAKINNTNTCASAKTNHKKSTSEERKCGQRKNRPTAKISQKTWANAKIFQKQREWAWWQKKRSFAPARIVIWEISISAAGDWLATVSIALFANAFAWWENHQSNSQSY